MLESSNLGGKQALNKGMLTNKVVWFDLLKIQRLWDLNVDKREHLFLKSL